MQVLSTKTNDGVATMTISIADDDHKFDVWAEDGVALVEYQESLTYRGSIEVAEPDDTIFKELMVSDEMTQLLDEWGVSGVKRAEPQH